MNGDDVTVYDRRLGSWDRSVTAVRPPVNQRPVCGQCRRWLGQLDRSGQVVKVPPPRATWPDFPSESWFHDDGTPRCPQGTADAVRALSRLGRYGLAWRS